ncbi:hypothetical protein U9M48_027178 [Paspalum notatum var. saurae]|uniref:Uncharacterized protein n=1 Tax=Paspalum notatum var. saurae TaxID=547442 RepID=A0AAQ3WZ49_PASNO
MPPRRIKTAARNSRYACVGNATAGPHIVAGVMSVTTTVMYKCDPVHLCIRDAAVVEVLENLAFLANASNLVTYLMGFMHYSPAQSATTVTNFMGTAFLLALLGGFLSDAFFTTYTIYIVSAFIEFVGLVILTVQARTRSLMPPACAGAAAAPCEPVSGAKKAMLFAGLYVTALGVGGIKGSLPSHGAEQFDERAPRGRTARSTFFNYYVFCLSCGALIAVTFAVWVEDNKGWQWGFGISTIAILLSIPVFAAGSGMYRNKVPTGSPLTVIAKVLVAAALAGRGRGTAAAPRARATAPSSTARPAPRGAPTT